MNQKTLFYVVNMLLSEKLLYAAILLYGFAHCIDSIQIVSPFFSWFQL